MTKNAVANYNILQIGEHYKRSEIEDKLKVRSVWPTGIREFSNCVFFFVTLDKSNKEKNYRYNDFFEKDIFYWESQKRQSISDPLLQKIIKKTKIPILFVRILGKDKFTYFGELNFINYDKNTNNPVQFSFLINNNYFLNLSKKRSDNVRNIFAFIPGKSTTAYYFKQNSRLQKIVLISEIIKRYSNSTDDQNILLHSQQLLDTLEK